MDLDKIKELKIMFDNGELTEAKFSSLKKKIINGEDINLSDYKESGAKKNESVSDTSDAISDTIDSSESSENSQTTTDLKRFVTEDFDKFNDKKTITMNWPGTINRTFFYMWFDKKTYGSGVPDWLGMEWYLSMRYVKTPDLDTCLIDYEYKGSDWLFVRDCEMTINLDGGENIKIIANESNTETGVGHHNAVQEVGFYRITKKDLKKVCDAKSVEIKIGASKGFHLINNEPNQENACQDLLPADKFQFMCRAFYSGVYSDNSYIDALEALIPAGTENEKPASSGCFIATAAMGSYDHPLVLDLRGFRDNWLSDRTWGESFIKKYYSYSPSLASYIEKNNILKLLSYLFVVKPLHIISLLLRKNVK